VAENISKNKKAASKGILLGGTRPIMHVSNKYYLEENKQ
jgi:hypothetical protein